MKLSEIEAALKDEAVPPVTPPQFEDEALELELRTDKANYLLMEAEHASETELLNARIALNNKQIAFRKARFIRQLGGNENLKIFEAFKLLRNKQPLPADFDVVSNLSKISDLQKSVEVSSSTVAEKVEELRKSAALIEQVRAENVKIKAEMDALQSRLIEKQAKNNERIKEENRHIDNVLGDIIEVSPVWVAFNFPTVFNRLTGEVVSSGASQAANETAVKTMGGKPSDLSAAEHEAMLKGITKEVVQEAISAGVANDSNKDILQYISQKVLGKKVERYGSLDTKVYTIRGMLGLRT